MTDILHFRLIVETWAIIIQRHLALFEPLKKLERLSMPTVQGFQSLEINVEGDDVMIRQGEEQVHFPVSYLQVVIAQMRAAVKSAPIKPDAKAE